MKKILLSGFMGVIVSIIFSGQSSAQNDKISIQITRDGKVVTDTSFRLKEGQDPEAVKKVISNVLDGDIQVISGKEGRQEMVWVTSHSEDIDVKMDSVMKHEEKVMVFGEDPGEDHHKVIVRKGSADEETVVVRSEDEFEISEEEDEGSKIIIITEKGDKESEGHQKQIKVIVKGDNDVEILDDEDLEWVEEGDADNIDVYVIKKDDGSEVVKKMKVEVKVDEDNDNGNDEAAPPEKKEPPKPEIKKK
jgi:hypothetical protein